MDIKDHINLIKNHGYDGYIAIYRGKDQLTTKHGDVVLVQNEKIPPLDGTVHSSEIDYLKTHRVIEKPFSENKIQEYLAKGNRLKTWCTCIGIPIERLERINI